MSPATELREIRIEAGQRRSGSPASEFWASRELTWMLAKREVQLRYRHSIAGIGWAVMQPLLTVLVLSIFQLLMGRGARDEVPYPLYAMTGLVPWTFFGHALTQGSNCILRHTSIVTKVHFPLLCLPAAMVIASSVDFIVALPLVAILMFYYGFAPGITILLLPVFVVHLMVLATGFGIWLAVLNTKYRDTSNALPFLMQLWFFLTPIAYPASRIPHRWVALVGLNPMVGVLEGFRWALFGKAPAGLVLWLAYSWAGALLLLVSGLFVFLREEAALAEAI